MSTALAPTPVNTFDRQAEFSPVKMRKTPILPGGLRDFFLTKVLGLTKACLLNLVCCATR